MKVIVAQDLLEANDGIAGRNRLRWDSLGTLVVNLISAPGAGKTTLLEQVLEDVSRDLAVGVIEGDIYTCRDAERIARFKVATVQINTKGACHLDAGMIERAWQELELQCGKRLDLLFIENVGNLVCPAEFDLGEDIKVALLSVSEGSDKPAKYPLVFHQAQACVLTKVDLLPYTDFDLGAARQEIFGLNPKVAMFATSAKTGEGVEDFCRWLRQQVQVKREKKQDYDQRQG